MPDTATITHGHVANRNGQGKQRQPMLGTLDEAHLFQLARDKSVEGRSKLARIIADLFDEQSDTLNDRERSLMFNIMHGVVRDVEMSVRKSFVKQLTTMNDAPQELVRDLANDHIDVAYPLLVQSSVLRDEDLIDIIRLRTNEHQLAITLRSDIDEDVTDALVEAGDESVIESLLENDNAKISEATMSYLVEQSERVDTYQEPLLRREDLGEELGKRMYMWVSAALRKHIVGRFDLQEDTVDELMEKAAEYELAATASEYNESETRKLVDVIKGEGIVTPNMLVAALTDGEVPLFIGLLSDLAEIKEKLAKRILFEDGGEGLAIASKALDIPEMQFGLIFKMSRKFNPRARGHLDADTARIVSFYHTMPADSAQRVLHRWQRGSDYLSAVRDLELAS